MRPPPIRPHAQAIPGACSRTPPRAGLPVSVESYGEAHHVEVGRDDTRAVGVGDTPTLPPPHTACRTRQPLVCIGSHHPRTRHVGPGHAPDRHSSGCQTRHAAARALTRGVSAAQTACVHPDPQGRRPCAEPYRPPAPVSRRSPAPSRIDTAAAARRDTPQPTLWPTACRAPEPPVCCADAGARASRWGRSSPAASSRRRRRSARGRCAWRPRR